MYCIHIASNIEYMWQWNISLSSQINTFMLYD